MLTASHYASFLTRKLCSRCKSLLGLFTVILVMWMMFSSFYINKSYTKTVSVDKVINMQQRVARPLNDFGALNQFQKLAKTVKLTIKNSGNERNEAELIFNQKGDASIYLPMHVVQNNSDLDLKMVIMAEEVPAVKEFVTWTKFQVVVCYGKLTLYSNEFAYARDIIVDPEHAKGRKGGEDLNSVLNQAESSEYYAFSPGFLRLPCDKIPSYSFRLKNHLNLWIAALTTKDNKNASKQVKRAKDFTLAVTRYEFVNLYHTMTDFYNAFLMIKLFKKQPLQTRILFVDGHPKGSLDGVWRSLFGGVSRIGHLKNATIYSELVWSMQGYNSPLNQHKLTSIPLVEEFRTFFLLRHNVSTQLMQRALNCSDIHILFIWRRDYVAHPRNPTGKVSRKIKNEDELVDAIKHKYSNIRIKAVQIDKFDMASQLDMVTKADILIGMHGAGLSHSLFLAPHAGLIEFYPTYWASSNVHFKSMAKWRNLHYENWVNRDPHNESPHHYTRIPPAVLTSLLKKTLSKMKCPLPPSA